MTQRVKEKSGAGDAGLVETGGRGARSVPPVSIPQDETGCNHQFSTSVSQLLDQAQDRLEWHTDQAERCRRDIRFYHAELGWHLDQATRAERIRASLERLAV